MTNSLESIAKKIQHLVEVEKHEFVKRVVGEIKAETLDSHFLVRSIEVNFSYDWDGVQEKFNRVGLQGLKGETAKRLSQLKQENKKRLENIFFWAILADHDFTEPKHFGAVLQEYSGDYSPLNKSERWVSQMEPFLKDLEQGKAGESGRRLYQAFQYARQAEVNREWPRYRNRFFYRVLSNCFVLTKHYGGSYETFLTTELSHILGKTANWTDIWQSRPEDWEKTKPWDKKLFGIGDNIFFYILRDIDFGKGLGLSQHGYVKLDLQNKGFFNDNGLWSLDETLRPNTNESARLILEKINAEIKRGNPAWPYTISHLNAAIYQPDKKSLS